MKPYSYPINSVLLLGPTGVGKSPLGDAAAENGLFMRRCHHLDFGSELRRAVAGNHSEYSRSEIAFIRGVLERGLLLENEHFPLARKIIELFLDRVGFRQTDVLVLNGIPRHEGQAKDMDPIARVHAVIVLDCSAEDVVKRIQSNVGGDRTERPDDDLELIRKKLTIFRERTAPLIACYERRGTRIYRATVTEALTPEQAHANVSALAAADPPVAFIAEPPQR